MALDGLGKHYVVRSALRHEIQQPDCQASDDEQEGLDLPEVIGDRQTGRVDDGGQIEQTEHHDAGPALKKHGEQADQHAADQQNLLGDLSAFVDQVAMLLFVVVHVVLQGVVVVKAGAKLNAEQEETDAQQNRKKDLQVADVLVGGIELPNLDVGLKRQRNVVHPFRAGVALVVEHFGSSRSRREGERKRCSQQTVPGPAKV